MPNMSYCRFQNTYTDLLECYRSMDDGEKDTLSDEEKAARIKLIDLCVDIACEFGYEVNRETEEI